MRLDPVLGWLAQAVCPAPPPWLSSASCGVVLPFELHRYSRRLPCNLTMRLYIRQNSGTRANHGTHTKFYALNDHAARADMATVRDHYASRYNGARRNMHMVADQTVMIDTRTGVEDYVVSNSSIRLYDHTRHDLYSLTQLNAGSEESARVHQGYETIAAADELVMQAAA